MIGLLRHSITYEEFWNIVYHTLELANLNITQTTQFEIQNSIPNDSRLQHPRLEKPGQDLQTWKRHCKSTFFTPKSVAQRHTTRIWLTHWISCTIALLTTKLTSTRTPMSASSDHKKNLNYPWYLGNLNNAPNNKKIAKRTYHHCHFHCLHYASSTKFESHFHIDKAATHKDQVETISKIQEDFFQPRPKQLKLQQTQTTTPNNTKQYKCVQIAREEKKWEWTSKECEGGERGKVVQRQTNWPGKQGKWRYSRYYCRVRISKFKLTKSYFFQLPLRRYHSPSYNCPTSQKQMFNENST